MPLAEGAAVTVVLGDRIAPPPAYAQHPRVQFVEAARFTPTDVPKCFQIDSAAVIVAQPLPHAFYTALGVELRRRRVDPVLYRTTTRDIERTLDQLFGRLVRPSGIEPPRPVAAPPVAHDDGTPPAAPVVETPTAAPTPAQEADAPMVKRRTAPKGAIAALANEHDDRSLTIAESARHIVKVADKQGITTTAGSVAQYLSKVRRQGGAAPSPRAMKAAKTAASKRTAATAVSTLNDAIAGLELLREYVQTLERENEEHRSRLNKFQDLVAALGSK